MSTVFISHSSRDKPIVRRLAGDLAAAGIQAWVDEAEIRIGDSLLEAISAAIDRSDYVLVVLSKNSVRSEWIQREVEQALAQEIDQKKPVLIPIVVDDVELPHFLRGKRYVDLSKPRKYADALQDLLAAIGSPRHSDRRPRDVIEVPNFAKEVAKEVAQILNVSPDGVRVQTDAPIVRDPKLVFVIMSFAPDMEPVFEGIQAAGNTHGLRVERVKDVPGDYRITDKVFAMIEDCLLVVTDLTHERPNVYFELGYARGVGKTVITTAREGTSVHFDVKDWTCMTYNDSRKLEKQLRGRFEYELKRLDVA